MLRIALRCLLSRAVLAPFRSKGIGESPAPEQKKIISCRYQRFRLCAHWPACWYTGNAERPIPVPISPPFQPDPPRIRAQHARFSRLYSNLYSTSIPLPYARLPIRHLIPLPFSHSPYNRLLLILYVLYVPFHSFFSAASCALSSRSSAKARSAYSQVFFETKTVFQISNNLSIRSRAPLAFFLSPPI